MAAATLLMTCSAGAFAQQISGTVVDKKSNETLIGAVVSVEGCKAKAVTDADGNFELNGLKNGKYTLYINYVGYKPQRIEGVASTAARLRRESAWRCNPTNSSWARWW